MEEFDEQAEVFKCMSIPLQTRGEVLWNQLRCFWGNVVLISAWRQKLEEKFILCSRHNVSY